ncbi:MAG: hypothetical protein JWO26_2631 [Rhodospirillales bacterium]|nr:hypothetical protein [Rhodospirillales bacterium]
MDLRTGHRRAGAYHGTAQKAAEELQNLLMQEIDHRAKNVLAVVQAALRLTPRNDNHAYAQAIEGRVEALARAHTLLAEGRWTGPDLLTLAHANWCRSRCRPPARRCRSSSSTVPQSRSPLRRHRGFRWLCTSWKRTRRNTGRFRFQAAGWRPDGRLTTWPACCRYVGTSVAGHRSQRPPRGEDLACACLKEPSSPNGAAPFTATGKARVWSARWWSRSGHRRAGIRHPREPPIFVQAVVAWPFRLGRFRWHNKPCPPCSTEAGDLTCGAIHAREGRIPVPTAARKRVQTLPLSLAVSVTSSAIFQHARLRRK